MRQTDLNECAPFRVLQTPTTDATARGNHQTDVAPTRDSNNDDSSGSTTRLGGSDDDDSDEEILLSQEAFGAAPNAENLVTTDDAMDVETDQRKKRDVDLTIEEEEETERTTPRKKANRTSSPSTVGAVVMGAIAGAATLMSGAKATTAASTPRGKPSSLLAAAKAKHTVFTAPAAMETESDEIESESDPTSDYSPTESPPAKKTGRSAGPLKSNSTMEYLKVGVPAIAAREDVLKVVSTGLPPQGKVHDVRLAQPKNAPGPHPTWAIISSDDAPTLSSIASKLNSATLYHFKLNPTRISARDLDDLQWIDTTSVARRQVEELAKDSAVQWAKSNCSTGLHIRLANIILNAKGDAQLILSRFVAIKDSGTAKPSL